MMKNKYLWVIAAILVICGATTVSLSLSSCEQAYAQEDNPVPQVTSEELIRTSQSWDGVELP
nr:cupin domain-containing protein [Prevotella sp.]